MPTAENIKTVGVTEIYALIADEVTSRFGNKKSGQSPLKQMHLKIRSYPEQRSKTRLKKKKTTFFQ